jgi:hypothetical protein
MAEAKPEELAKTLWTVELPRGRMTRWHQTLAELTLLAGQAIGIAMTFGIAKATPTRVEMEIDKKTVRVWVRGGDEEFVALDAHVETSQ